MLGEGLPEHITVAELAKLKGVSPQAVRRRLKRSGLPHSGIQRCPNRRPSKTYPRGEALEVLSNRPKVVLNCGRTISLDGDT